MVDSISFCSFDWDTTVELSNVILNQNERAIELPSESYAELVNTLMRDDIGDFAGSRISVIEGPEEKPIYIFDFISNPYENYGVFIGFEDQADNRHLYFTTGTSATDFLIELFYKGAVDQYEQSGRLIAAARSVVDYIDANIRYPDVGVVHTRKEVDMG